MRGWLSARLAEWGLAEWGLAEWGLAEWGLAEWGLRGGCVGAASRKR
ncbi:hypothetical protein GCM10009655_11570 [Rhodoglobus aureus]|uniref:Uncharacterized protein n=1 Tax=Rhodoglobus aureus TaxID=191497 RepID=A0ABN1VJR7_9MICO